MATYLSTELGGSANQTAVPTGYRPKASVYGARVKRVRATIALAAQATTDVLQLCTLPPGAVFAYGVMNSTVSLGSSTLALGIAGTTGKYKAAAAFTATDTPTLFGLAAEAAGAELAAEQVVIGTIAAAALPASGTLVIDIFYSSPN